MIQWLLIKKAKSLQMRQEKQGRGAYVSKDVALVEKAQQREVLEKYFNATKDTLDPVYKEIIRLIYREEIPK